MSPTLGIPHGMLQFSVALIRKSHRGLAIDGKKHYSETVVELHGFVKRLSESKLNKDHLLGNSGFT